VPPARAARTTGELVDGRTGVGAALWGLGRRKLRELQATKWEADIVSRKLRELSGRRWGRASEQARHREAQKRARAALVKEADRRALQELAHRIEKETGRRPAVSTLRRHNAAGTAPRGVDADKLARQAAIDNGGSITKFARRHGISTYAVKRWRDEGGDLPQRLEPESLDFSVAIVATLYSNGQRYKHDTIWHVDVTADGDAVARIAEASRTSDYDDVADLIAVLAADQFPWVGQADRVFEISDVIDINITP
jgi:hypothetical protein